jgi:hypothetical protein
LGGIERTWRANGQEDLRRDQGIKLPFKPERLVVFQGQGRERGKELSVTKLYQI